MLLFVPPPLAAQGFFEQFSYEGLRLSGIGVEVGGIASDRTETTVTGAVRVDYGYIAPKIRVVFGAAYMRADFDADEIDRFERRLEALVANPPAGFAITIGPITWTDYAGSLDLEYLFTPERRVRPYLGLGLGLHVRDGDGTAIDGTFVEDALDTIDAGLAATLGVEIGIARHWLLTAAVRGEVTGELRTVAARGGLMLRIPQGGS